MIDLACATNVNDVDLTHQTMRFGRKLVLDDSWMWEMITCQSKRAKQSVPPFQCMLPNQDPISIWEDIPAN